VTPTPQGSMHEGDCAVCGDPVRYMDYCPHIYLCRECGYPNPAPNVEADGDGRAYVIDAEDRTVNSASEQGGQADE